MLALVWYADSVALRKRSLEAGWESADVRDLRRGDYPDRQRGMLDRRLSRALGPMLLQENSEEEVEAGSSSYCSGCLNSP